MIFFSEGRRGEIGKTKREEGEISVLFIIDKDWRIDCHLAAVKQMVIE